MPSHLPKDALRVAPVVRRRKARRSHAWLTSGIGLALWAIAFPTALFAPAADLTAVWDGTSNDWTSNHWSTANYPNNGNGGFTYDAVINGGTVTLDQEITLDGLSLSGGTLTGGENLTLVHSLAWVTGGAMTGSGVTTVDPGAVLTLSNPGNGSKTLSRTLVNEGTANWLTRDNFLFSNGTFQNSGTFNANAATAGQTLQAIGGAGSNTFQNDGVFTKLGLGAARFDAFTSAVSFNNAGTVDVQQGFLQLLGGGTHLGDFSGAAGATLEFGRNHTFAPGSEITGNMGVSFTGGVTTYGGSLSTTGRVLVTSTLGTGVNIGISSATIDGSVTAGTLELYSGSATVHGPIAAGSMTVDSGTVTGSSDWTISNSLTLNGATLNGSGTIMIAPAATLSIPGNYAISLGRNVVNDGAASWTGFNQINLVGGVTFQNNGSFLAAPTAPAMNAGITGSGTFNNAGTFSKQGAIAVNTAGVTFNNAGTVDVQSGKLHLSGGGTHTGDFTGLAGATLEFGGNHALAAGADVSGDMNVRFSGGVTTYGGSLDTAGTVTVTNVTTGLPTGVNTTTTVGGSITAGTLIVQTSSSSHSVELAVDGPIAAGSMTVDSGTVTGSSDWTISNSLTLNGATLNGSGTIMIAPAATLSIPGNYAISLGRNVVNDGAASWTGFNQINLVGGVTFQNNGSFLAAPTAPAMNAGITGSGTFNNAGTFSKQGAIAVNTAGVTFNNAGTVDVQSGKLHLSGGGTHTGDFTGLAGATLEFGGNHAFHSGSQFSGGFNVVNTGNVTWNSSSASFAGSFDNRGSLTILSGATLGAGSTTTNTGTIRGNGAISGNLANSSLLAPGNSPGILTINGNYTQTASGTLEIEVGGLTAGSQHDKVVVTGTATLGGRYEFPIIDGFMPQLNDEIVFLTATSVVGSPNSLVAPNLAAANPDVAFQVIKNAADVRLRFVDKTAIQFVDNTGGGGDPSDWNVAANWQDGMLNRVPLNTDVVNLSRSQTGSVQRVEVKNADATSYELTVQDPTSPIEIAVTDGRTLTASVGDVTIGDNATVSLGSTTSTATLAAAQEVEVSGGGVLRGNGTIAGDLVVGTVGSEDAMVSPGFSVGALEVTGDYLQGANGNLIMEIDGVSANEFDTIEVAGSAVLGGTLTIDASELGAVAPGTTLEVLAAGSIASGSTFAGVETVGSADSFFAPIYLPGAVAVAAYTRGDMNCDGIIDSDDVEEFALALVDPDAYLDLRGLSGSQSGNVDGIPGLDFDDIDDFASLLGMSTGSVFAAVDALLNPVPEPGAMTMVAIVLSSVRRSPAKRRRSAAGGADAIRCGSTSRQTAGRLNQRSTTT
jgi:hypothetical protein